MDAQAKKADDERQVPLKQETLEDKKKQYSAKVAVEERSKDKIQALTNQRSQETKEFDSKRTEV